MTAEPFKPWLCIDRKDGCVVSSHCTCMAGFGEACSYIAALLFAIEAVNYSSINDACTSMKCIWASYYKEKVFTTFMIVLGSVVHLFDVPFDCCVVPIWIFSFFSTQHIMSYLFFSGCIHFRVKDLLPSRDPSKYWTSEEYSLNKSIAHLVRGLCAHWYICLVDLLTGLQDCYSVWCSIYIVEIAFLHS